MLKTKIIFVGSFKNQAKDGSVGGQMFACKAIINSELNKKIDFLLLDTTAESVPAPPVYIRLFNALKRLYLLLSLLFNHKDITSVLIFTSAGFSFLEKGIMCLICLLFNKKIILAPRSGLLLDNYNSSRFYNWYIPFIIKKVDAIICQGNSWKKFYQKISSQDASKFIVINNGINTLEYTNLVKTKSETIRLLYMGWLESYKGIQDLIEAYFSLLSTNPELKVTLHIAGKGSLETWLLNQIKNSPHKDKIIFEGWKIGDEKLQLFSNTDILILPSHREGMPNVLLEAMACQIACIACEVGGVSDIITSYNNGICIPANNPERIKNELAILISNHELRNQIAINAQDHILKNHDINEISKLYNQILLN